MDGSQTVVQDSEPHPHRWAGIVGTSIAILTMTLPLIMIAHYSPSRINAEPITSDNVLLPQYAN